MGENADASQRTVHGWLGEPIHLTCRMMTEGPHFPAFSKVLSPPLARLQTFLSRSKRPAHQATPQLQPQASVKPPPQNSKSAEIDSLRALHLCE